MVDKYYYHGIKNDYTPDEILCKMLEIIKTGGIKSRRLQGKLSPFGFNGNDYISICKRENADEYSKYPMNAFFSYIQFRFCFIISDDIPAIKTQYLDSDQFDSFAQAKQYMEQYPNIRFSDMFDEWQVKDEISLNRIIGIGLPINFLMRYIQHGADKKKFKTHLSELYDISEALHWDIVNTDMFFMAENDYQNHLVDIEKVKKIVL